MTASLLSPTLIDAFADAARRGIPIETTCELLEIPYRTFSQWCQLAATGTYNDGDRVSEEQRGLTVALVAALKRARAEREAEAVDRMRNWRNGKGETDWRAELAYLTHSPHTRARWHEEKHTKTETTVVHQFEKRLIDEASPDQIEAWSVLELPEPEG